MLLAAFLISCTTGYHPLAFNGGYEDLKLNNDTYRVSFRGNGYTDQEKVFQYALRRCAELTKKEGYQYFVILDTTYSSKKSTFKTPESSQSNATYTGGYGYINENRNTEYTGGNTFTTRKHQTAMIIQMWHNLQPNSFDANIVLNNFKS